MHGHCLKGDRKRWFIELVYGRYCDPAGFYAKLTQTVVFGIAGGFCVEENDAHKLVVFFISQITVLDSLECTKREDNKQCCCNSCTIEAEANRHADSCSNPHAGGGREAVRSFAIGIHNPRAKKTNTNHNLRRNTKGVKICSNGILLGN